MLPSSGWQPRQSPYVRPCHPSCKLSSELGACRVTTTSRNLSGGWQSMPFQAAVYRAGCAHAPCTPPYFRAATIAGCTLSGTALWQWPYGHNPSMPYLLASLTATTCGSCNLPSPPCSLPSGIWSAWQQLPPWSGADATCGPAGGALLGRIPGRKEYEPCSPPCPNTCLTTLRHVMLPSQLWPMQPPYAYGRHFRTSMWLSPILPGHCLMITPSCTLHKAS
jgi:hypothetical protein